ncbi:MAG: DUF2202 domain-containing protein [Thiotrichales bacterium]|nr:DUF2202 domain-containing protein [Thiotrichales bacterium]
MQAITLKHSLKLLSLAFLSSTLLSGCGGASSPGTGNPNNPVETESVDIRVERGPVLYSHVVDSVGVKGQFTGNNVYSFSLTPTYPIRALGGYIDLDGSQTLSAGDLAMGNLVLQASEGSVLTIGSTLANNAYFLNALIDLGFTETQLTTQTPADDKMIAALSDAVFEYAVTNAITDLSQISTTDFDDLTTAIEARISEYQQSDLTALQLESALVTALADADYVSPLTLEEASELATLATSNPLAVTQASFAENDFTAEQQTEFNDLIAFSWNEEKMAKDLYLNLYSDLILQGSEIKSLTNVANNSETKHQESMRALLEKYDLEISSGDVLSGYDGDALNAIASGEFSLTEVQDLYDRLWSHAILHANFAQGALEAACMVEVVDVNDLNASIEQAQALGALELVVAFENLRSGSYNHYWAFNNALIQQGVAQGCGVLGADYVQDYPQVPKGQGNH